MWLRLFLALSLSVACTGPVVVGPMDGMADADGEAGLFLADEGELRGGWIVRADGAQRGAVLHRTTGDIVSAQPIKTTQTQVVLQSDPSPLRRLASPALPQ